MQQRLYNAAYDAYSRLVKTRQQSFFEHEAVFKRAECLYQQGRFVDASTEYDRYLAGDYWTRLSDNAVYRKGQILYHQGRYRDAMELFVNLLRNNEHGDVASDAAFWAGRSASKCNDTRSAVKYYTITTEYYPHSKRAGDARFLQAYELERSGDLEGARRTYEDYLASFPHHPLSSTALTRLASCLNQCGQYSEVVKWIDSLSDSPDPDNIAERLWIIANAQFQLGKARDAERLYRSFLSAYPMHPRSRMIRFQLGRTYLVLKKYTEAAGVFDTLGNGQDAIAHAAMFHNGLALRLSGRYVQARDVFQHLLTKDSAGIYFDAALLELAFSASDEGDLENAERYLVRLVSNRPTSPLIPNASMLLGDSFSGRGKFALAASMYIRAAEFPGTDHEMRSSALLSAGVCLSQAGLYDSALTVLQKTIDTLGRDPKRANALLWSGECALRKMDYRSALGSFQQAMDAGSNAEVTNAALVGIASCRLALGEPGEALAVLEQPSTNSGGGIDATSLSYMRGDVLLALGRYSDAISSYRGGMQSTMKTGDLVYGILQSAYAAYLSGDPQQAITLLRTFTAAEKDEREAMRIHYAQGWLLLQSGDVKNARVQFASASASTPSRLMWQSSLATAICDVRTGSYPEALTRFKVIADSCMDPGTVITAIQGIVHCRQAVEENIDQSEIRMEWYKQHRGEAKADPILLAWARDELSEGSCGPAANACGDLVKADSLHASSQAFLLVHAQCLSHAGKYHQSALELKRVIDIDRQTESALDALMLRAGMAYESQERRYAIELYSSALRDLRYPARRSELHYLRGLAYVGLKCIDSAQMDFRQAMSVGGNEQFRVLAEIELSKEDAASDQSSVGLNRLIEIGKSRRDRTGSSAAVAAMRILVDRQRIDDALKLGEFIDKTYREFPECMRLTYILWGRAYEITDHLSKAKQMYQRIIQDYPGSREAIEAQSRLEEL